MERRTWRHLSGLVLALALGSAAPGLSAAEGGKPAAPAKPAPPSEEEAKSLDRWIAELDHRDPERREAATESLRGFGPRALPALRARLEDPSEERRARVRLLVQVLEAHEAGVPEGSTDWITLKGDMGRTGARGEAPGRRARVVAHKVLSLRDDPEHRLDAPLAVQADLLVVARGDRLTALSSTDLAFRWEVGLGARILASPVIAGDLVYVGTARGLVALRLDNHREAWTLQAAYGVGAAPLAAGNTLYACMAAEALVAVDARTGAIRWQHRCDAGSSAPVLAGGRVILGTRGGEVLAVDAASGKPAWTVKVDGMMSFAPAAAGSSVLVGDGGRRLRCIDAETGRVLWTRSVEGRFMGEGPAMSARAIVFTTTKPAVEAYDPSTGRRLWRRWMGTVHLSSPVLAGDLVLVGSRDRLKVLELDSGDDVWEISLGGDVTCPLVAGGMAYALAGDEVVAIR